MPDSYREHSRLDGHLEEAKRTLQRRLPAGLPGRNGRVGWTRRPAAIRRLHCPGSPLQNAQLLRPGGVRPALVPAVLLVGHDVPDRNCGSLRRRAASVQLRHDSDHATSDHQRARRLGVVGGGRFGAAPRGVRSHHLPDPQQRVRRCTSPDKCGVRQASRRVQEARTGHCRSGKASPWKQQRSGGESGEDSQDRCRRLPPLVRPPHRRSSNFLPHQAAQADSLRGGPLVHNLGFHRLSAQPLHLLVEKFTHAQGALGNASPSQAQSSSPQLDSK